MIKLADYSTVPPKDADKGAIKKETKKLVKRLEELQYLLYAEEKHSLLIVLQGMDAFGKDGTIKNVLGDMNPLGVLVRSFKKPSEEEMEHDFLWRVHKFAPKLGMIEVFNRSHYEDVLIQRVFNWIDMDTVKRRWEHINNFERLLSDQNNTTILKFFLYVSKEKQLEKLEERKVVRRKMWKHNDGDMAHREHWEEYMQAYEDVFNHCSPEFPWTIVPSDENWYKEYLVAKKVVEAMEAMNMEFPMIGS